jgi:deoxycytidylate deaminase
MWTSQASSPATILLSPASLRHYVPTKWMIDWETRRRGLSPASTGRTRTRRDPVHCTAHGFEEARRSYDAGGCPIGGVLVSNDNAAVLGKGHNSLVQENNPIIHGEMAAIRAAKRMKNRHNTTLYTTLQPCFMCAGAIVQFGISTTRHR